MALSSSLFLLKGTDKHIQTTNSHERTLMHSTTVLVVVVGWFFDSQITRDGQQRRQQRWKQRNCCLFHRFHCFISGFRFPCACLLECERASLRVSFQCQLFLGSQPVFVFWSSRRARVNQPPVCVSLSYTHTHYLTLVRVLSAIRNTLIKIIKKTMH